MQTASSTIDPFGERGLGVPIGGDVEIHGAGMSRAGVDRLEQIDLRP